MYPGNSVLNPNDAIDPQSKILALLLHKSLVPVEKEDPLGERWKWNSDIDMKGSHVFGLL